MQDSSIYHDWLTTASDIQTEVSRSGLSPRRTSSKPDSLENISPLQLYDEMVTSRELVDASRKMFADGHYATAVEKSFVCLNNKIKEKSGLNDKDGADLMRMAFSAKSPVLALNSFQSQSDKNEQLGYMEIFAGVMIGIRNPRAHDHILKDDPEVALELLILANHLMRIVEKSSLAPK